jgi:hypothetical protein
MAPLYQRDDPGDAPLNTGGPASIPYGASPWDSPPQLYAAPGAPAAGHPQWGPPDPAAVSGPPWPALLGSEAYTPPRLIRWPIVASLAAVAVYLLVAILSAALSGSTPPSSRAQRAWLASHDSTIKTLNRDQTALKTDSPASGGNASRWLADWHTFHDDVTAAAGLPNPGAQATVPWREMLNDYASGSAEIIQAIGRSDSQELAQAERDLRAGDQAARRFNQSLGISAP